MLNLDKQLLYKLKKKQKKLLKMSKFINKIIIK